MEKNIRQIERPVAYVPHRENAFVPDEKIEGYLLSIDHPDGAPKARFFRAIGFSETSHLRAQLLVLVRSTPWRAVVATSYGHKYVVQGTIRTPTGRSVEITTVWFVRTGEPTPRLVTAYPT